MINDARSLRLALLRPARPQGRGQAGDAPAGLRQRLRGSRLERHGPRPATAEELEADLPEHVPSSIAALTPAPKLPSRDERSRGARGGRAAARHRRELPRSRGRGRVERRGRGRGRGAARQVAGRGRAAAQAPRAPAVGRAGRKAAFTLRLDAERHLRLRLATAVTGRSAQQIVTGALDALLDIHSRSRSAGRAGPARQGASGAEPAKEAREMNRTAFKIAASTADRRDDDGRVQRAVGRDAPARQRVARQRAERPAGRAAPRAGRRARCSRASSPQAIDADGAGGGAVARATSATGCCSPTPI